MAFSGGTGTELDPYQIASIADFRLIESYLSSFFVQTADIDLLTEAGFRPIQGTFAGAYDGGGYVIRNLDVKSFPVIDLHQSLGLFEYSVDGVFKNIAVDSVAVKFSIAPDWIEKYGTICAEMRGGSLTNCHVTNLVVDHTDGFAQSSLVGGLLGSSRATVITNCSVQGELGAVSYVGGLVGVAKDSIFSECYFKGIVRVDEGTYGGLCGQMTDGTMSKCYAEAELVCRLGVSATNTFAGGLVGLAFTYNPPRYGDEILSLRDCYAWGSVEGYGYVGGAIGGLYVDDATGVEIYHVYSAVSVTGAEDYFGGLVGLSAGYEDTDPDIYTTFTSCKYDQEVYGCDTDYGKGEPFSTLAMKTLRTFSRESWDFIDIWGLVEGVGYPTFNPNAPVYREPVLMIRWMDDNKGQWSAPRMVGLGGKGDTSLVKAIKKLGSYKTRQYELVWSDEVPVTIAVFDEYIKGEEGQTDGS